MQAAILPDSAAGGRRAEVVKSEVARSRLADIVANVIGGDDVTPLPSSTVMPEQ